MFKRSLIWLWKAIKIEESLSLSNFLDAQSGYVLRFCVEKDMLPVYLKVNELHFVHRLETQRLEEMTGHCVTNPKNYNQPFFVGVNTSTIAESYQVLMDYF